MCSHNRILGGCGMLNKIIGKIEVLLLACHGRKTLSLSAEGSQLIEAITDESDGLMNPDLHVVMSSSDSGCPVE